MQWVFMVSAAALFVPVLYHRTTNEETDSLNKDAPGADARHLHHRLIRSNNSRPAEHLPNHSQACVACPTASSLFAGITTNGIVQLLAFCLFEVCVGVFWPSMMSMRAQYVPEEMRSTIINLFRCAHAYSFMHIACL